MKSGYKTIGEYIKMFPPDVQGILQTLRQTIKEAAPGSAETISYQMPAFKLNGKILVYFAAWKNHIGLYPTSSGIERFKKDLSAYTWSKGAVQFPLDRPLPLNIVKNIVRFRVEEIVQKK